MVVLSGCDEGSGNRHLSLLGVDTTKVNPNALSSKTSPVVEKNEEKNKSLAEERKSKLELSKLEAETKIKIAKIQSESQMHIAKVKAETAQKIAKSDALTKMQTSQLDVSTRKETMQYSVYIVIAIVLFFIVGVILVYLNGKKNRELQKELQEAQFRHERDLREKEFEERRIHKILDLVSKGKLAASVQKEVLLSISAPKNKVIENINKGDIV
ncbi:hypothetical protein MNB_SM-5-491 [hydrothermal vent metagenome]|uniref:Uncharacterized protein n=1 Tax=hydrothermal vent metagenome TaxID=652676 RepID=A0A1W1CUZ5_9ZZZZ